MQRLTTLRTLIQKVPSTRSSIKVFLIGILASRSKMRLLVGFSLLVLSVAALTAGPGWSGEASLISRVREAGRDYYSKAFRLKKTAAEGHNNSAKTGSQFFLLSGPTPLSTPIPVPPGGVTFNQTGFTDDGTISRASGKTWYFKNFNIPSSSVVYWGAANNRVRLSFVNNTFSLAGEAVPRSIQRGQLSSDERSTDAGDCCDE